MSALCLKERRLPTYSDMEEYYRAGHVPSFEFDHKYPSWGRYRAIDGIRAYESGYVEVAPSVRRNQELRRSLAWRYGLDFHLPKECRRVKFFTPDSAPVAASAITTHMLFLDRQTQRAYSYEWRWRTKDTPNEYARICFVAPGAVPIAHASVHACLPNMERVKAVLREHKEFFKACATTALLMQGTYVEAPADKAHAHMVFELMLRGEAADVAGVPLGTKVRIGEYVTGKAAIGIRGKLTKLSIKSYALPYLKIVWG